MPKFSLIIPVYNIAPYLRACLDSIVGQTFSDWEAICVDDGSKDASGQILEEYAARDGRFRVIHKANAGLAAARNTGIEVAKGTWLWFVDGDDLVVPRALQILNDVTLDGRFDPLHMVSFGFEMFSGQLKPEIVGTLSSLKYATKVEDWVGQTFFSSIWVKIFRREAIGSLRAWDCPYNEDAAFVLDYAFLSKGWLVLDAKLYCYRKRAGSITCSKLPKKSMEIILRNEDELLDKALAGLKKQPDAVMDTLLKTMHFRSFRTYEDGFFKLTSRERSELLPLWIAVQRRYLKLYAVSWKIRLCIKMVFLLNSGFWAKPIVLGLGNVNAFSHKLKHYFCRH